MDDYAPRYIEHGMGRAVAEQREEHHLLGIQWFHEPQFESYPSSLGSAFF